MLTLLHYKMSKKVLIIDVGNTATEFAVFNDENLQDFLGFFKFPEELETAKKVLKNYQKQGNSIDDGMIFSVVPEHDGSIQKIVKEVFQKDISVFDWIGYKLEKKNPEIKESVGADLVADLIEAKKGYGGPCLIADFGTVTKLLYIDENNSFEGLSFIPGIEISLKAFNRDTALLPESENLKVNGEKLGLNTLDSMNHGVYWSTVYYVKNVFKSLKNDKAKLILTGGNLRYVKDEFPEAIIDPQLTLKGMLVLYKEVKHE